MYRDGTEIEIFLNSLEAELANAGVELDEWKTILLAKITPKCKNLVLDLLQNPTTTYLDIKNRLYNNVGMSKASTGSKLWVKDASGKSVREVVWSGTLLLERLFSGCESVYDCIIEIMKALLRQVLSETEQAVLDSKMIKCKQDLIEAGDAIDTIMDGKKLGHKKDLSNSKHFGTSNSGYRHYTNPHPAQITCFKCNRQGHRAIDCRSRFPQQRPYPGYTSYTQPKCFTCGQLGHKSPECPKNMKEDDQPKNNNQLVMKNSRGDKKANVVVLDEHNNVVEAAVNGKEVTVILDTGAQISVVPASLVESTQYLDELVTIQGVSHDKIVADVATVAFKIGNTLVQKDVAVVPDHLTSGCVLYSIDIVNDEDHRLLEEYRKAKKEKSNPVLQVDRVTTRSQAKNNQTESEQLAKREVADGGVATKLDSSVAQNGNQSLLHDVCEKNRKEAVESGAVGEDVQVEESELGKREEELKDGLREECLGVEEVLSRSTEVRDEELAELVGLPNVREGSEVDDLRREIMEDLSLEKCRNLAMSGEMGYYWLKGILFHRITDIDSGTSDRIVLPKCRRERVLRLSHDGLGHLSTKKVRHFLNARFTWPYIARDVENYCRSCLRCQQTNKSNNKKSRMVPRPVINVPFESVALNIVGPLPKRVQGFF